jgi:hypothetical protein
MEYSGDASNTPSKHVYTAVAVTSDVAEEADSASPEGTKVVLNGSARLWSSAVHILPMLTSVFLVYMNLDRWFWFDESGRQIDPFWIANLRNGLQLVAKLHEILVVLSLSALTLNAFKRQLVGSRLPIGLLTGAYRVGDIPYLFGASLWSSIRRRFRFAILLGLFLAINTITATLVGPASAILMVPELDWFPLRDAFSNMPGPVLYGGSVDGVWNPVLSAYLDLLPCIVDDINLYAWWCPAGGFSDLWNWVRTWESSQLQNNLDFQEPSRTARRRLYISDSDPLRGGMVYSTTISMTSIMTIGRLLNHIQSGDAGSISGTEKFKLTLLDNLPIYQPLVQTQCVVYDKEKLTGKTEEETAYYDFSNVRCFRDLDCERATAAQRIPMPEEHWNKTLPMVDFYPVEELNDKRPLLARAVLPYLSGNNEIKTWIVACSFVAHWAPATLSISPSESDLVESNITNPSIFADLPPNIPMGRAITILGHWTRILNPVLVNTNTTYRTALDALILPMLDIPNVSVPIFSPGSGPSPDRNTTQILMQRLIGSFVTDGVARSGSASKNYVKIADNSTTILLKDIALLSGLNATDISFDFSAGPNNVTSSSGNITQPFNGTEQRARDEIASWVKFEFKAQRFGYGSGKPGSAVGFAIAVMYLYGAILVAYFLEVMVLAQLMGWDRVGTVVPWGDIEEMMLLAWNSRPQEEVIRQSGQSAWGARIWGENVAVRADETNRVQLVSGREGEEEEEKLSKLVRDRRYRL